MRQLGIPTVLDRMVQQALLQVLQPHFDPTFSEYSFGFRPGRSAHDAVRQARWYVASGYRWVVDMDLEKFFDRVNHDVLMARLARRIEDKRILLLIRRYLQAGAMEEGLATQRTQGTPQGGPLSPLLSNILLDELDRELERRGHAFVRYADDCNIYVRSERAGHRVLASIEGFLNERLRLTVNQEKSAVDHAWNRTFLGYRFSSHREPRLRIAPESLQRFREKTPRLVAKRTRQKPQADHPRHQPADTGVDGLLPSGRNPVHLSGTGRVDSAQAARHPVAAVETTPDQSDGTDPEGGRQGTSLAGCLQQARTLVECWGRPYGTGVTGLPRQ